MQYGVKWWGCFDDLVESTGDCHVRDNSEIHLRLEGWKVANDLVGFRLATDDAPDEEAMIEKFGEDMSAEEAIRSSKENSL